MKKLVTFVLVCLYFFGLVSGVNSQEPAPVLEPDVPVVATFPANTAEIIFSRKQPNMPLSAELTYDLTTVPTNAVLSKTTFSFTQEGTSSGLLRIVDKNTGQLVDSLALGTAGTKTTSRVDTVVALWVKQPTKNFGLILQAAELEPDNEITILDMKIDLEFTVPDTTSPVIQKLELTVLNQTSIKAVWETDEDVTVTVNYGKTSNYGQKAQPGGDLTKQGEILLEGLNSNITYHLQFIAEDKAGNKTRSENLTIATSDRPSAPGVASSGGVLPPRLLNSEVGNTVDGFFVDMAWSKSESQNIDGYIIYKNSSDNPYSELTRVDVSVLRYTDVKVEPGVSYSYYVVGYKGTEQSSRSPVSQVNIPAVRNILGITDFLDSGNKSLAFIFVAGGLMVLISMAYFFRKKLQNNIAYNEKIKRHSRLHNYLHDPDYYINGYEDAVMEKGGRR